ncbi:membrane-associated tyrosine- and threonine-specific cdc2-inhibitory kinase [Coregonus clupeaformis]|uniref:membrane-associated tyrosine- and threonine-specific cdc2-inhibitory kinase n=1 Tax=Coregonus clupeaformis TaxID=59861 RepID=UPI001E1C75D6|nr:membrane-associated tyrosine- and threonine-specific cdc2-inhibitory kinase [Coregonus clupeaformis]
MSVYLETKVDTTPLPLPTHFSKAEQSFSLKKRRLPFSSSSTSSLSPPVPIMHSLPPRPPSKGCPPLSRVFPQRPPSPWSPLSRFLIKSPPPLSLYDPSRQQSYFNQCFTNLGLLGRGSFGEVYKVLSLQDGHHYAVKRSVQRFRGNGERNRSVREAQNHERLCPHPHILGFVAAWEEGGRLYIQMELCCTTLLLHAEAQPSSPDEPAAWTYLCDLLSALHHLHARGFTHLDLKPANVFLTRSGRLKLGDFGLALELRGEGVAAGLAEGKGREKEDVQEGDPRYMAPELLRGEYGPAADVFSLGVSILELACNMEVPKGGEGWQQLRQGHLPAEFTNALSVELQTVLRMMLAPEVSVRATVPELLNLPVVRRHRWRRHVSLLLRETLLTLVTFCQSILYSGWGLFSALNLPFLPRWMPPSPCTPPKESSEKEFMMPPSAMLHTDSGSLEDGVFLPDALGPEHSPTFFHRIKSRLSMGSTSTPLPNSPPVFCQLSPAHTPTHTSDIHTPSRSLNLTHTPSSIHSDRSRHTLTAITGSPKDTGSHRLSLIDRSMDAHSQHNTSTHSSQWPVRNWVRSEPLPRPSFEPKNLLSLFDETTSTLEGNPENETVNCVERQSTNSGFTL